MALAAPIKKGGRYTRKQQEERRIQVYRLHFEQKQAAVKIAKILGVNRNTISDDIRFWDSQLADKIGVNNIIEKMNLQILKMGIQRDRLLVYLEDCKTVDEKLRVERFISEIDNRLVQLFPKLLQSNTLPTPKMDLEEIDEDRIKELVRDLILSDEGPYSKDQYTEEELKFEYIQRTKCDLPYASQVIEKMKRDGLEICSHRELVLDNEDPLKYDLGRFARLRNYLTLDETKSVIEKRTMIRKQMEQKEEREEKFIAKYGSDKSKWSADVRNKFEFGEYL